MDHEKWLEQHDQMMADHEIWLARHDRDMVELRESQAKTENTLRRAIRLSVQENRNERKRRQELAELAAKRHQELAELAARRHQELEELLKAFLNRGGNGKH